MSVEVCIDASVIVKWELPEEFISEAEALARDCLRPGITIVAPDFVFAEVGRVFWKRVRRGLLDPVKGLRSVLALNQVPIQRFNSRDLGQDAWRIASAYQLGGLYDAHYVALAERRGCDFWTADERLINCVRGSLPYVKHIRDFVPGMLGEK